MNKGLRTSTGLVVETGSAREVHHFALLGGYGAEAVHPYLAFETLISQAENGLLGAGIDGKKACKNFVKAIGKGLKKVMSKMGISTYMSYTGAQIFEAVGLSRALIEKYFAGTTSNVEGIGVFEVAEEAMRTHRRIRRRPGAGRRARCGRRIRLARARRRTHVDARCHREAAACRARQQLRTYKEYAQIINDQSRRHMTFRGLFEFKLGRCTPVPIEEVEPAKEIVKRFLHRRDVARFDLDRSAHHAGDRDEPHRRQIEHRRRRRRPQRATRR